jgi:GR25 family glycosyltransferase involved in LPS biosynthesis
MFSILDNVLADKGFFINLDNSNDRLHHINNLISKYNIKNLVRFPAQTDELKVYSCTKSHLELFKLAKKENLEVIFVGEDDFNIEDLCYYPKQKKQFSEVLKNVILDLKNVDWDVVLFGCNPKEDLIYVTDNLYSVTKSTGSWAYLIKKRAYEHLINTINYKRDYIAIDDHLCLLSEKGFKVLTTIPLLINHGVGFESTIQPNGPVNYNVWIQGNYHNFIYDKPNYNKPINRNDSLNKVLNIK